MSLVWFVVYRYMMVFSRYVLWFTIMIMEKDLNISRVISTIDWSVIASIWRKKKLLQRTIIRLEYMDVVYYIAGMFALLPII